MQITNIKFRNFRSYGNTWTEFVFPANGGELISIYGVSGAGKSSVSDVMDWSFYKKVRGKKREWATISSLYNRFNGGTESIIEFISENIRYSLHRTAANLEISGENGLVTKGGKSSNENFLSSLLELDIDTFKNFVSVDISHFRNFSSMKTSDKRELMDKLFSLEMVSVIGDIASQLGNKSVAKSNELHRAGEVLMYNSIKQRESSMALLEEKKKSLEEEMKGLKKEGKEINETKKTKEAELESLTTKTKEIFTNIEKLVVRKHHINHSINHAKGLITNINNNICPHCLSPIDDNHRSHILSEQKKLGKQLVAELADIEEQISANNTIKEDLDSGIRAIRMSISEDETRIRKILERYRGIENELETGDMVTESYWKDLERQSIEHKEKSLDYQEQSKQWAMLKSIFSENGIKKDIIENLCHPINEKMNVYSSRLDFPYIIRMDSSFDMHFYDGSTEIDVDTLSKGEEARANMALLLAWLSIIHSRVKVNILFLDEIFKPLDPYTTELCIKFMKEWAMENHINVITTHHSELPMNYFDKVYKVTKNVFSSVERVK